MSYDEPEQFKLYDLVYRATPQQANQIWLELISSRDWQELDYVDNRLRYSGWRRGCESAEGVVDRLCRERMRLMVKVTREAASLIALHVGEE